MPKPLTVWITINWKILKEVRIPEYLSGLLRNLYAGQEATVRTGHGTTDWFQIGKGVHQVCVLLSCLFSLYIENPKGNTKRLLEPVNKFSKLGGYKNNIQKLVEFLCIKNYLK